MIGLYIIGILFLVWLLQLIIWWVRPYKALNWLCHDIMGWHKPDHTHSFDGLSEHSHCRFCKKEIMQDSQGNWFTY